MSTDKATPQLDESPMGKFRNSVGFQLCFFQYSGLSEADAIDHICNAAHRLVAATWDEALAALSVHQKHSDNSRQFSWSV